MGITLIGFSGTVSGTISGRSGVVLGGGAVGVAVSPLIFPALGLGILPSSAMRIFCPKYGLRCP